MSGIETCSPKIYVVHHKPLPPELADYLSPIRVSHYDDIPDHIVADHTGDNIASKNREYAELTALYWMWKNDKTSTHVGLWHYRRWMVPHSDDSQRKAEQKNILDYEYSDPQELERFKITDQTLVQACTDYDVILPYWESFGKTIEGHFASCVSQPLLEIVYYAFDKLHPDYPSLRNFMHHSRESIYCSMAIMRRDLLNNYCNFLFPLLAEAAKDPYLAVHLEGSNPELAKLSHGLDPRWAGFWGECLLAYYAKFFWLDDPAIRVDHWQRFVFNKY